VRKTDVSRETAARLDRFEELVTNASRLQNLVSAATLREFKTRHIGDGVQLVSLAPSGRNWCDIGSGAGLPGIVVAIVSGEPVTLIEPRRLRAEFLRYAVAELALARVEVIEARAERVHQRFDVITARAVAELGKLFAMAEHLAHPASRWILPKGRSAKKELEAARQTWQGEYRLVPSCTSDDAMIVVAERVRRRGKA